MNRCLWCGERYFPKVSWSSLLDVQFRRGFCERCWSQFDVIQGPSLCAKCGRLLQKLEPTFIKGDLCSDCVAWSRDPEGDTLSMNRSLFTYNAFMQDVIARFKFRGDAILVEGFREAWCALYRQYFKDNVPVPIPLSAERLAERHFNQAWMLAALLPVTSVELLNRVKHNEKQSKKSRRERLSSGENPFALAEHVEDFRGKSFVIIDDIYTTGSTVREAAHVLKELEPSAIYSMTLAR